MSGVSAARTPDRIRSGLRCQYLEYCQMHGIFAGPEHGLLASWGVPETRRRGRPSRQNDDRGATRLSAAWCSGRRGNDGESRRWCLEL